jgi:hypothetical protein
MSLVLLIVFVPAARFISTNSTEAGFPIFAAIVAFAFFIAGSDCSSDWEAWRVSGFAAIADVVISGWADDEASIFGTTSGLAFFASTLVFLRCRTSSFFAAMVWPCNTLESICGVARLEHANPVASVHPANDACCVCCGAKEHPIKVAVKAVMRSGLMKNRALKIDGVFFWQSY